MLTIRLKLIAVFVAPLLIYIGLVLFNILFPVILFIFPVILIPTVLLVIVELRTVVLYPKSKIDILSFVKVRLERILFLALVFTVIATPERLEILELITLLSIVYILGLAVKIINPIL
ncbi:hypothetical protein MBCUR_17350 [Methanobrevibacter curvatus]|uniref:Uncharacterized protein n=1 Tax=Methanobrevibacter curvatus TaxID=49547 RepID=A0A165ZEG4_9EURY|nr:hypothetical protein MBCUR_17350 [Methanobrevibacter curvatus]